MEVWWRSLERSKCMKKNLLDGQRKKILQKSILPEFFLRKPEKIETLQ